MELDFREIIPDKTLPRFNCQKRIWIEPAKLDITKTKNSYLVSYKIRLYKDRLRTYKINLPLRINIDKKFLVAIGIYLCEGRNPNKGVYTNSSANKGRYLSIVNSDHRIVKLVIDEFESKLGIDRNKWCYRLVFFDWQDIEKEKVWWGKTLSVRKERISIMGISKSDMNKVTYAPHGRCASESSSVVHAAIIYNLGEKLLCNKLFD